MGLFNIFRVCSAFFLAAAIIPAHANYIYDNRTGTWTPTVRTVIAPPGSASPFNYIPRDSPPTVTSMGAFQNKTGGTFGAPPINGTSSNVPVTLNGTTTPANVKKSLLSRLGRGGLAGLTLGLGIDALLNSIDALIDDAGNVSRVSHDNSADPENIPLDYSSMTSPTAHGWFNTDNQQDLIDALLSRSDIVTIGYVSDMTNRMYYSCATTLGFYKLPLAGWSFANNACYYSPDAPDLPPKLVPVPPNVLEDAINSNYQPHPSDYPTISAEPSMIPTIVEVEPIPTTTVPPTTTTTVDVDTGKTTTVTTNIWQDYSVKDNNSPQPKINADTTTKTDTYEDGVKTGESTTTTSSGTAPGTDPIPGSGSSQKLEIDIPTDCDFMPTVCAFLEWFKDDDLDEEPDLASIMKDDEEFAKTKVISFGAAVCPQPYTVHISSLSMSVDLSFEFFCQFAEYARALVLAAAYIFAAYISLGVARG